MKKILLVVSLILINSVLYTPVSAAEKNTETVIMEKCSVYTAEGDFEYGSSCDEGEDIFYIRGKLVSKDVFDNKKADFDLHGSKCLETKKSTSTELPKGFSISCKKGKYGDYFLNGKKTTYKEFINAFFGTALDQAVNDSTADQIEQLTDEKKVLKSFKSFVNSFESREYYGFIGQYPVPNIGSDCSEGEHILINKTGYEIAECVDDVAVTINYYWQGKKMTFDKYLKAIYKSEKSANAKAIKELKKKK